MAEPPTDPTPPVIEADDETDDIEIVEDLRLRRRHRRVAAAPGGARARAGARGRGPDGLRGERAASPPESSVEPVTDPFAMLVAVLEDVALTAGAGDAAMATLRCVLGRTRLDAAAPEGTDVLRAQALAWQGILRGESEDFAACGSGMLDEWCAALVASVLGQPVRADGLKRDLRRRGVAAFGLVEQAA